MSINYTVIGIMSGTSLDGVDLACVRFGYNGKNWTYTLLDAETKPYSLAWKKKLTNLIHESAQDYVLADIALGHLLGQLVNQFISSNKLEPDFIASHGHTIFHQPQRKLTKQIGNGASIAAITGLPTVCDFRSTDVAKGGQGAPLVPIGDRFLYEEYDYCLNLGGIANISFEQHGHRVAFDICPVNMGLNYLAGKSGKLYDKDGRLASKGIVNKVLLNQLNSLSFYKKPFPKSLGAEWFNQYFKPLLDNNKSSLEDKHATVIEHICLQIHAVLQTTGATKKNKMLVTGGGAFHRFLVQKMKAYLPLNIIIPDAKLIIFKEALVFAFLGVLRWRNEINTLASVTGATNNSSSGAVYMP